MGSRWHRSVCTQRLTAIRCYQNLPSTHGVCDARVAVASNALNLSLRIGFSIHFLLTQVDAPPLPPPDSDGLLVQPQTIRDALTGALPGLPVIASLVAAWVTATLMAAPQGGKSEKYFGLLGWDDALHIAAGAVAGATVLLVTLFSDNVVRELLRGKMQTSKQA